MITKVWQIIKFHFSIFVDNFRNSEAIEAINISSCRDTYDGYFANGAIILLFDPWNSQGDEKMEFIFLVSLARFLVSEMKI